MLIESQISSTTQSTKLQIKQTFLRNCLKTLFCTKLTKLTKTNPNLTSNLVSSSPDTSFDCWWNPYISSAAKSRNLQMEQRILRNLLENSARLQLARLHEWTDLHNKPTAREFGTYRVCPLVRIRILSRYVTI